MRIQPRPLASLRTDKCSLGCPVLDAFLQGGLPCGSITEVTGEPSASKTQFSLQALLSVQLPLSAGGLGGSAVYIYTEGEPAMRRLRELAAALRFRHLPAALVDLPDPTANVFLEKGIHSGHELLARLGRLRALLLQRQRGPRPVRLIVVDSVGHVLRDVGEHAGTAELVGRTEILFKLSALLRRYADEFNLAVLCVNQITDSVARDDRGALVGQALPASATGTSSGVAPVKNTGHTGGLQLVSLGREVVPALGLAWANCINTRIFLSRCSLDDSSTPVLFKGLPSAAAQAAAAEAGGAQPPNPPLRRMQVVFSPYLPQSDCYYVVEQTGVHGLHPAELEQHQQQQQAELAAAWQHRQSEQHGWAGQRQSPKQAGLPPTVSYHQQQEQQTPPLDQQRQQQPAQLPPQQQEAQQLSAQRQLLRQHFLHPSACEDQPSCISHAAAAAWNRPPPRWQGSRPGQQYVGPQRWQQQQQSAVGQQPQQMQRQHWQQQQQPGWPLAHQQPGAGAVLPQQIEAQHM